MQTQYSRSFLRPICTLAIVLATVTGCRGPKLDSGYSPRSVQDNSPVARSGSAANDSWSTTEQPAADIGGWEVFDGRPPTVAAIDFEAIADRRWGPIYFAFNQSFIGETERRKLDQLADYLLANRKYHVIIEGHCDEQGSEEFNRTLGEKRALAVRDYLVNLGVNDARMQTISYGEERPADTGHTEAAHAKNRRAEFVIGISKAK